MLVTQWMYVLAAFTYLAHSALARTAYAPFLVSSTGTQMLNALSYCSTVLCRSFLLRSWMPTASVTAVVPHITPIFGTSAVVEKCRECKEQYNSPLMGRGLCNGCFNQKLGEKLAKLAIDRNKETRARLREEALESARLRLENMRM